MKQFLNERVTLFGGDSLEVLKEFPENSIDAICCDPPYALVSIVKRFGKEGSAPCIVPEGKSGAYARASRGFMGKEWDTGDTAFAVEFWMQCYRVLKPGGHVLAFGGTRTNHRLVCAIEDAGFEIRDMVAWLYGTGFPKSHNVGKGFDKAAGVEREILGLKADPRYHSPRDKPVFSRRNDGGATAGSGAAYETLPATEEAKEWEGWGTALKPALEPICLARKPLSEKTVAKNVLKWGTGALNIDGCRVSGEKPDTIRGGSRNSEYGMKGQGAIIDDGKGRWPANVIHDGSDEVLEVFPITGASTSAPRINNEFKSVAKGKEFPNTTYGHDDNGGSVARFFYSAKANKKDRAGSKHPTVKPIKLIRYLCRLITPPGGIVLDPFAGSGTTGEAAYMEGYTSILIEREPEYQDDIAKRFEGLEHATDKANTEI